jgi:hypothetical protein
LTKLFLEGEAHMPREHQENCLSCSSGIQNERNHYFTGKFMTAGDFEADQSYMVSRHRLHNRLLHGWGILCGLEVDRHPNPDCEKRWVIVRPGAAIDCCGRELLLPKSMAFELPLPRPKGQGMPPSSGDNGYEEMHGPFLLGLAYSEVMIDYVPALYAENACDPQRQQPNRVREGVQFQCLPLGRVGAACWEMQDGHVYVFSLSQDFAPELDKHQLQQSLRKDFMDHGVPLREGAQVDVRRKGHRWEIHSGEMSFQIRREENVLNVYARQEATCKDCDEESSGASCLEPDCVCQGIVPLALVHFDPVHPENGFELRFDGRKHLPASSDLLTHIIGVNWHHGENMTLKELQQRKGQLRIRFDRKLLGAERDRRGINRLTFQVQYGGEQRSLEFLPNQNEPFFDEDKCEAVFDIDRDYYHDDPRKRQFSILNNWVYVTLKCDFILDCHHLPVDGNHLRGHLPSGDGVPGGTFESWFWVGEKDQDHSRNVGEYHERDRDQDHDQQRNQPPEGQG